MPKVIAKALLQSCLVKALLIKKDVLFEVMLVKSLKMVAKLFMPKVMPM